MDGRGGIVTIVGRAGDEEQTSKAPRPASLAPPMHVPYLRSIQNELLRR